MPLHWTIDTNHARVTATAEGPVTRADFEAYMAAVEQAGALGYLKLFDGTSGTLGMTGEELLAIGVKFRSFHDRPVGALGVVLPGDRQEAVKRILGILASADRPMRLFKTVRAAEHWLDTLEAVRPARDAVRSNCN